MDLGSYDPSRSKASVCFHSASTLWFSDVGVRYPDWLNMYEGACVFCVWTSSPVNMFVCILLVRPEFLTAKPSPSPPPRQRCSVCFFFFFYRTISCWSSSVEKITELYCKRVKTKKTFPWIVFLWQRKLDPLCWPFPAALVSHTLVVASARCRYLLFRAHKPYGANKRWPPSPSFLTNWLNVCGLLADERKHIDWVVCSPLRAVEAVMSVLRSW